MSPRPVCILIHPDGRAEWRGVLAEAEEALGPHGVGKTFLTPDSRLRIAMSDCALVLPEEYPLNPYAVAVLAHVAGARPEDSAETRGPVVLFGWDPFNSWDSTRLLTDRERVVISEGLAIAGCSVS